MGEIYSTLNSSFTPIEKVRTKVYARKIWIYLDNACISLSPKDWEKLKELVDNTRRHK